MKTPQSFCVFPVLGSRCVTLSPVRLANIFPEKKMEKYCFCLVLRVCEDKKKKNLGTVFRLLYSCCKVRLIFLMISDNNVINTVPLHCGHK